MKKFNYITPEELTLAEPSANPNEYLVTFTNEDGLEHPICACWSRDEAIGICHALNTCSLSMVRAIYGSPVNN